ncbi:MAG: protein kinase [Lachnospiraceae bacterium]|nr:protein kinase [Lachnospiraceae bacterium]
MSGNYRVVRIISDGDFGRVTLIRHEELNEYRILKSLPRGSAFSSLIENEARILTRIESQNVPKVLDYYVDERVNLVLQYFDGETLEELLKNQKSISQSFVLKILNDILETLVILHGKHILHLDISPSNIIVCDNKICLIDFGSSKMIEEDDRKIYGTVDFITPEQKNGGILSEQTDVYQVGCLIDYLEKYMISENDHLTKLKRQAMRQDAPNISCEKMLNEIKSLMESENGKNEARYKRSGKKKAISDKPVIIGFFGIAKGCGTTFMAIMFGKYLKRNTGRKVVMAECNSGNAFSGIEEWAFCKPNEFENEYILDGVLFCRRTSFEEVTKKHSEAAFIVCDFGSEAPDKRWNMAPFMDRCFIVGSAQVWKREEIREYFNHYRIPEHTELLLTGNKRMVNGLGVDARVTVVPFTAEPFSKNGEIDKCFRKFI